VVFVAALIVAGALLWGGVTLLLDAWWKRQPTDLADRLMPFQPGSVPTRPRVRTSDRTERPSRVDVELVSRVLLRLRVSDQIGTVAHGRC
jgi:hypothetical protein